MLPVGDMLSCHALTQRLAWPTNTKDENLQANLLYLGWKHLLNQLEELLVNSISRALFLYRKITPTFVIQERLKRRKEKIQRRNKSHLFQIHRDRLSVQKRKFEPLGVSCVMQRADSVLHIFKSSILLVPLMWGQHIPSVSKNFSVYEAYPKGTIP